MKTQLPCIMFFITLTVGSPGKELKNSLQEMNLYGQVKTIKEISYGVTEKNGSVVRDTTSIYSFAPARYYFFNEQGNLTEKREEHKGDSLPSRTQYKYNDNGLETERITYVPGRQLRQDTTYTKYNEKGYKTEEIYKGWQDQNSTFSYDNNGRLIEKNTLELRRNFNWKTQYIYDEKGNLVEENTYRPTGELNKKITYKYDEKGNKIEMQQAGPVNRSFKVNYNYDQWNNTLEETEFNLNLNKQNTTTIKYEFDLKNNWIKKTIWYNMVLTVIAEREIKYYE